MSLELMNFLDYCDSLLIRFESGSLKDQALLIIYRSPSMSVPMFVNGLLDKFMSSKANLTNLYAIAGDFNMCLNKYHSDVNIENFYDSLLEMVFIL